MSLNTRFPAKSVAILLLASLAAPLLSGCVAAVAGGVAVGAMSANDRRTTGTQIEDQSIESKAESRISAKYGDKVAHVNVISFNRHALLTGEVADAATKVDIEKMVRAVPNVAGVHNELTIAPVSSFSDRTSDGYITSKVKARLVDSKQVSTNHVKVVTERKIVYLMGLVSHKEGDAAASVASTTGSVAKVITLFEYLD
ncbi:BON domain-containing protein [Leeia sp. TBRC 13508]|uniref:BON domain-containing protein n=1 Tax=Leeia speluncae TaxID=2884804 RepID=A0ABS8D3L9_9NEIS|nr:BON domain-containing protein [Leeia speluncae]MCB6182623.1 BON domain-containing protein [Leeia speluncae]